MSDKIQHMFPSIRPEIDKALSFAVLIDSNQIELVDPAKRFSLVAEWGDDFWCDIEVTYDPEGTTKVVSLPGFQRWARLYIMSQLPQFQFDPELQMGSLSAMRFHHTILPKHYVSKYTDRTQLDSRGVLNGNVPVPDGMSSGGQLFYFLFEGAYSGSYTRSMLAQHLHNSLCIPCS